LLGGHRRRGGKKQKKEKREREREREREKWGLGIKTVSRSRTGVILNNGVSCFGAKQNIR
jgi:hypothetical protein